MRHTRSREVWWTRERVVEGLRRFYRDFGFAPTSTEAYQQKQQFTGTSQNGVGNPYPSFYGVLKYFRTFREAWTAAGVKVNRDWEEWTTSEDWFIAEAAGLLTRNEIAAYLDRTPNAVHRRLYDLGINSYEARGWTFYRIMRATQVPDHIIRKYADRGDLPYLRGSKCLYVDPADLLVVKEINWNDPPTELAEAVRRSLMTRLVTLLSGKDWRANRPYQPHPIRTTGKRWGQTRETPAEPKPVEIDQGDLVKVVGKVLERPKAKRRVGLVQVVYWSANKQKAGTAKPGKVACWMARVEFKRQGKLPRLKYTLPLSVLKKV